MSEVNLIWEAGIWDDGIWSFEGQPIDEEFPTTGSSSPQRSRRQRQRVYALAHKVPVALEKKDKPISPSIMPFKELLNKSTELHQVAKAVTEKKLHE